MDFLKHIILKAGVLSFLFSATALSAATENAGSAGVDAASVSSGDIVSEPRHEQKVSDLAYGVSLYHFFQGQKLAAITNLSVAIKNNTIKYNTDNAELLLASLYFDYGLPDEAEKLFSQLLDEDISNAVRNRVWFNLARVQYEYDDFRQTEELLSRITEKLPTQREAEKQYILTNLLIDKQRFGQASKSITSIDNDHIWRSYSEYNLGVALTAKKNIQKGHQWLKKLITRVSDDEELLYLQDSARLILGLSLLKQGKQDEAITFFGAIRADGVLSNKALLATGWAWSRKSQPKKSLTYWNILANKAQTDDAALESNLAIAYAYEQLNNKNTAAQYYKKSALLFDSHLQELDGFIDSINKMDLIRTLNSGVTYSGISNSSGSDDAIKNKILDYDVTPYIQHVVASKPFQRALQDYNELLEIMNSLRLWKRNLPVLELMLDERNKSFAEKRPQVEQTTDFKRLQALQQRRDALADEVAKIEHSDDIFVLANEDEVDYLEQLQEIKDLLTKLETQRDLSEEKEKYTLFYGLLYWDIQTDFPRRYWRVSHELQLLDRALAQAGISAKSLQQAAAINEKKLDDFSRRISGQDDEIQRQLSQASLLIEQQQQRINQLAIRAIEHRKQRLLQLRLSARYSLARVYDEISKQRIAQ